MFASESVLGARVSNATSAGSNGVLLDPQGLIVSSATTSTSFGAGEATTAVGTVGTAQPFRTYFSTSWGPNSALRRWNGRVLVRVPWTLTTHDAAGGSAAEATMQAAMTIDGVSVGSARGASRNVHTGSGSTFTELIELDMSAGVDLKPGSVVAITIQPYVTVASGVGGSSMVTTLRHDPQTIADQLVVEFTGCAQV